MTQQFHEGQDVKIAGGSSRWEDGRYWRDATIGYLVTEGEIKDAQGRDLYTVWFRDGTRGIFDTGLIRAVSP